MEFLKKILRYFLREFFKVFLGKFLREFIVEFLEVNFKDFFLLEDFFSKIYPTVRLGVLLEISPGVPSRNPVGAALDFLQEFLRKSIQEFLQDLL